MVTDYFDLAEAVEYSELESRAKDGKEDQKAVCADGDEQQRLYVQSDQHV